MPTWPQVTARFGAHSDMLGFAPAATPSADEWLVAFTRHFLRHPDVAYGAQALMSGLRFYTADFVAALAALPPGESRHPAISGNRPQAIYTATGPLIAAVYEQAIRRNAGRAEVQAAFTAAAPGLLGHYDGAVYVTSGAHLSYPGAGQ
jgi:hypothetical protein